MKKKDVLEKYVRKEAIKATTKMLLVGILVGLAVGVASSFTVFGPVPTEVWIGFGVFGVIVAIIAYFDFKKEFTKILENSNNDEITK